jgi:hypothetical protein
MKCQKGFRLSLILTLLLAGSAVRIGWGLDPSFDSLFKNSPVVVLQANFGVKNPQAAGSPSILRQEFHARLFGKAEPKTTLVLTFEHPKVGEEVAQGVELRLAGKDDPEQVWPVAVNLTPNDNGVWSWEGTFSMPKSQVVQLDVHIGNQPSIKVTLGTVWIMAGSPNLAVNSTVGQLPDGVAVVRRGDLIICTVEKPSTVPRDDISGPLLPEYFSIRLANILNRPTAVYVVAKSRKMLRDWELAGGQSPKFHVGNPLWYWLWGDQGVQRPVAG